MNKDLINVQKLVIPEIIELMELRYDLLSTIKATQSVGRRNLASELSLSERQVRNEVAFFQSQGFVEVGRQGIRLTSQGESVLVSLKQAIFSYKDFEYLVIELKRKLNIRKVFIVPGDCKKNKTVLEFMGKTVANYIINILKQNNIIAVTGGSSVAAVSRNMPSVNYNNVTVLPVRGGIGKSHSIQANIIVSIMSERLHSQEEMLHLPDNIDKNILELLKASPDIDSVFQKYDYIDILIFGIGRADVMAKWRKLSSKKVQEIKDEKAVAETFGYFLNSNGEILFPSSSVGISEEQYYKIPNAIAIAGGKDKAKAIKAACNTRKDLVLVTDESAALEILNN